ncbi:RNA-binding domain-containing protein [Desulfonatronum parangueonense]
MTFEQLHSMLMSGESSTVEFKTEDVRAESLAGEIVSMANFAGGVILIGVEDDGTVQGVQRVDMETFIVNVCRNAIRPSILPQIEKMRHGDKLIYVVTIEHGDAVYATATGKYFIRVGSTKQPTQQELLRLFQKRNLLQFDETPVLSASPQSIAIPKVDAYLRRLGQQGLDAEHELGLEQELVNLSILTATESGTYPTLAGLLVFGKDPQKHFPSYTVSCGAYAGSDFLSDVIREEDLTGTQDQLIENAIAFLKLTMPKRTHLANELQRVDTYLYPVDLLREAVVNAVCHRDYTITGSSIRVLLFQDRLEIRSPGALPNTLTLESMIYRQFTRNQALASFLAGLGYMEKRGKGILKMMRTAAQNNIECDFFLTKDRGEFVVRLTPGS